MEIVFRVDSSYLIGTGHVMRCLTLAETLRQHGANCTFICRDYPKNIYSLIQTKAFPLYLLEPTENATPENWLGVPQEEDAKQTISILKELDITPDWLIVDNYFIDITWEQQLREHVKKIMVIDDLANRLHDCDILLDQNSSSGLEDRYMQLCSFSTKLLIGSGYSIVRHEFTQADKNTRPLNGNSLERVLVYFGSTDPYNLTLRVIRILSKATLANLFIEVILSNMNDSFDCVVNLLERRGNYNFYSFHPTISQIMSRVDMCIGAGGSTAKERIIMGLPSVVISYGKDQHVNCLRLQSLGQIHYLGRWTDVSDDDIWQSVTYFRDYPDYLKKISQNCLESNLCSGLANICYAIMETNSVYD